MRQPGVQVVLALVLMLTVAGCDSSFVEPPPEFSAADVRYPAPPLLPGQARRVVAIPRHAADEIVLRVVHGTTRGPCIHAGNTYTLTAIDQFKVVEPPRGKSRLTLINVRPGTPKSPDYPGGLAEGQTLTVRLTLADETRRRMERRERLLGDTVLWIDGDELKRLDLPR